MSKVKAQISRCICRRKFSLKIEIKHFFSSKRIKILKSWHALAPHMKKRTTNFCLLTPLDDPCLLTRIFVNDSETLKRVESILSGPHSGAFCQIVDIFVSGFGKLNIDSDLLFVSLVYEEKTNVQTNVQK